MPRLSLVLVLSLLAIACQPGASPSPSAADRPPASEARPAPAAAQPVAATTLSSGVLGSLVDLPVYIALDRGYFKEEGLELNLAEFNSAADMIPLLATDQLHIGAGG